MKISTTLFALLFTLTYTTHAQYHYLSWNKVAGGKKGHLYAHFFENYPYAFTDVNGQVKGIEVDILREFALWLKKYKGVDLEVKYRQYDNFSQFYASIKDGGSGMLGCGSVTNTNERRAEVQFSAPYLRNAAVLASAIEVNTLISYRDFPEVFKDRVALIVKNSVHEHEMKYIRDKHYPGLQVEYVGSPKEMLMRMKEDPTYFGYVDIITYWSFINEQGNQLRLHRIADLRNEHFGFILPKNSDWGNIFNEFMAGGLGFTSTAAYHAILDKYLDLSIINEVQEK